jgi:hypothetical protein
VIRAYSSCSRGARFDEPEQLLDAISEFLDTISVEEGKAVFDEWVARVSDKPRSMPNAKCQNLKGIDFSGDNSAQVLFGHFSQP